MEATVLFEESIKWLEDNYTNIRFFTERDVVWTIQTHLIDTIKNENLPFRVFNDYPVLRGKRRGLSADIVIFSNDGLELAVEFKYEPNHEREDIPYNKFPVVFWKEGVIKDIERIRQFTDNDNVNGKTTVKAAYAVLIDEGSHFSRTKAAPPGSEWYKWEVSTTPSRYVSVLISKASAGKQ